MREPVSNADSASPGASNLYLLSLRNGQVGHIVSAIGVRLLSFIDRLFRDSIPLPTLSRHLNL